MSNKYRNYVHDFGAILYERALEARHEAATAEPFQARRALAYFEAVSLMLSQAVTFEIPPVELGLDGVEPDRDLL